MGLIWALLVGAVLGITMYTLLYHRMIASYRQGYKERVFAEMINELGSQYSYKVDGQISDEVIRSSCLFFGFNKKQCEDLIAGKFDRYEFEMAEIRLFNELKSERVDRGGGLQYIFKGLFFVGTIPMSFPTKVWILSKNHPKTYGEDRVQKHWQKIELKHLAFRKEYLAYAEDKDIAYQILPDSILDVIVQTREAVVDDKMRLELSFQGNQVFLSISTTRELFEPPIKTSILDKEDFKANFKYLVNTTRLLQQLTLVRSQ
jgi:hypothetical protein